MIKSALILDRIESKIHQDFINTVDKLWTRITTVSYGFTSVWQPRDVRIAKQSKAYFTELFQLRKVAEYARLEETGEIPTTGRAEV